MGDDRPGPGAVARSFKPALAFRVLPVADRAFDVVVSTLTFHHLTDSGKRSTLTEVCRVLCPAGRLLLIDFGRPTSLAAKVLLTVSSLFDGRANMRANLAGELPTLLHQAGFDVAELHPPRRGVHYLQACSAP